MTIPFGGGTEVATTGKADALSNAFVKIIDGDANHIYTVLSVTFTEAAGNAEKLVMAIDPAASGSYIYMLLDQSIAGFGTFVWNDSFVITGTDELIVKTDQPANVDVWVSYIDQDWT
jgi:hypothetical protein